MKNFITDTAAACAIIALALAPTVAQSHADNAETLQVVSSADLAYDA